MLTNTLRYFEVTCFKVKALGFKWEQSSVNINKQLQTSEQSVINFNELLTKRLLMC